MTCKHRAVLIVTRSVRGTSSNVAKERTELQCQKPAHHDGQHHDPQHDVSWQDKGHLLTHVLRHEDGS